MKNDIKSIKDTLKDVLETKRYEHTLGVADTAANLALAYEVSFDKAYVAGLLHDCAKCYSSEKMAKLCKKYSVILSEFEKVNSSLIHAKLGAALAEKLYDIKDPEIIDAISFHTTGKPEMSRLTQIVFCADFIEPGRKPLLCLPSIREVIYKDIDKATAMILQQTIHHLKKYEQGIDSNSLQALEYYERISKHDN